MLRGCRAQGKCWEAGGFSWFEGGPLCRDGLLILVWSSSQRIGHRWIYHTPMEDFVKDFFEIYLFLDF